MADASAPASSTPRAASTHLLSSALAALNIVALGAALSFYYYAHFRYRRPVPTDAQERAALRKKHALRPRLEVPTLMPFKSLTINISSNHALDTPAEANTEPTEEKLHYVTLEFSLELRDARYQAVAERLQVFLVDRLITLLSKKTPAEVSTIQGRYVLHSQMIDEFNDLIAEKTSDQLEIISNVYFTQFVVQ